MNPNKMSSVVQKMTSGDCSPVTNAEMYRTPLLMMCAAMMIGFVLNIAMLNTLLHGGLERDRRMLAVETRLDAHLDDGELNHPHGVFRFVQLQSDRMDLFQSLLIDKHDLEGSPEITKRLKSLREESQSAQKDVEHEMDRHRH